ncbi:MAG: putative sulfate/molybdate transporter [Dehalococcoidales bacterium]|nr:putative sulfate/molybdate transporter [Dehalococcoidales bacterium]
MRIKDFEFNLRELAGSMGDFGTLFPLAIGYFAVNGLDPAGVLVMMGLANIVTGIVYHLPMPIEPKKVLAVVAISQKWTPTLIYAAGFGTGIVWLILGFTGLIQKISKYTPRSVVRGIQIALGITLAIEGFKMVATGWILGVISILVVVFLRTNKYAPAAIILMLMGIGIIGWQGELIQAIDIGFTLPPITLFRPIEVWQGMVQAGFAQIALTAANAIIATSALISQYFPDRPVPEKKLAINMGIMNVIVPFFGGMPMCHGAGGLAGQYYYGARTGGTNIIEGIIEIAMGLFLAGSIGTLFALFPESIIGAMLLLVGVELTKFVRDIKKTEIFIMALTAGLSLLTNMAIGFVAAIVVYHLLRRWGGKNRYSRWLING